MGAVFPFKRHSLGRARREGASEQGPRGGSPAGAWGRAFPEQQEAASVGGQGEQAGQSMAASGAERTPQTRTLTGTKIISVPRSREHSGSRTRVLGPKVAPGLDDTLCPAPPSADQPPPSHLAGRSRSDRLPTRPPALATWPLQCALSRSLKTALCRASLKAHTCTHTQ